MLLRSYGIRERRSRSSDCQQPFQRQFQTIQVGAEETMKTFSDDIEAVGAIDWEGMGAQPLEYVALAVRLQERSGALIFNAMDILPEIEIEVPA